MIKLVFFILLSTIEFLQACELTSIIEQNLLMDGFHRNITSDIEITGQLFENFSKYSDCEIGLYQLLPAGIYANPDELNHLSRYYSVFAVTNNTDVELPAEQSVPNYVFITQKAFSRSFKICIPVHARYQKAIKSGGYVVNEIKAPQLYMQCPGHKLHNCKDALNPAELCTGGSKTTCEWKELTVSLVSPSPIKWYVPVGDLNHFVPVAIITAVSIVMGSAYLLWSIQKKKLHID